MKKSNLDENFSSHFQSHAQHLRAINFTILATSVAILFGVLAGGKPTYTRASSELNSIVLSISSTECQNTNQGRNSETKTINPSSSCWDESWLEKKLFEIYPQNIFTRIEVLSQNVANYISHFHARDLDTFSDQLMKNYGEITHGSDGVIFRDYSSFSELGPLLFFEGAEQNLLKTPYVELVVLPCVRFSNNNPKPDCTRLNSESFLSYASEDAESQIEKMKRRPSTLGEFIEFWRTTRELEVHVPSFDLSENAIFSLSFSDTPHEDGEVRDLNIQDCWNIPFRVRKGAAFPQFQETSSLLLSSTILRSPRNRTILGNNITTCNIDNIATTIGSSVTWSNVNVAYADVDRGSSLNTSRPFFGIPVVLSEWERPKIEDLFDSLYWNVEGKRFEEAFPNLNEVTPRLRDLSWNDLEAVLEDQIIREAESVTIIGIEVPSGLIFSFGAMIVIAIKAYFFMHILGFLKLNLENRSLITYQRFPWIGLGKERIHGWLIVSATCVFPDLSVVVSGIETNQLKFDGSNMYYSMTILLGLGLTSFLVGRSVLKLNRLLRILQ